MHDADAIQAIMKGDKERYAELVERYQGMVYAITWSRLGNADLCEDAAQETFIKAYRYLVALRDPARFSGWLARIAKSVSVSMLRTRKRELERGKRWQLTQPDPSPHESSAAEGVSLPQTLREALENLPVHHRECLVLYYMEGKSVREAAERLGISESNLKTRLHRARQALRGELEERLEESLSRLGPRKGFSAGIVALLPSAPLGAQIGGASLAVKAAGSLAKLVPFSLFPFLIMPLFQGAFVAAFFGWLGHLESKNLAPGESKKFRKRIIRSNVLAIIFVAVSTLLVTFAITTHFGYQTVYYVVAAMCVWGTYRMVRMLRFNRSPFVWGQFLAILTFLATSLAIGFFHAPTWVFIAALLPLNVVLYQTNKSRPIRHDYNLFLRQVHGLMGTPPSVSITAVNRESLLAFVRFLGERFLIQDFRFTRDGLVLRVPPVKAGFTQFLRYITSNSSITIGYDGFCVASLGSKDYHDLRALSPKPVPDKTDLESSVAASVLGALHLHAEGRREEAASLLQAEADSDIFLKPVGASKEHRARGIIAIVAAIFLVPLAILMPGAEWLPQRVTRDMANTAIAEWCTGDRANSQLLPLLSAARVPSLSFVDAPLRPAYKAAFTKQLTDMYPGDVKSRLYIALRDPRGLYHVLNAQILSKDELAGLGFTSAGMRAVLGEDKNADFQQWLEWDTGTKQTNSGTYRLTYIERTAQRLAVLKELGCLDAVNSEPIVRYISAAQVHSTWEKPTGYEPIDIQDADGLLHFGICDLRSTYWALLALDLFNQMNYIDRKACIQGIMCHYKGGGVFRADWRKSGVRIYGGNDDTIYALESLALLEGLDRVSDLKRLRFKPKTTSTKVNGVTKHGIVTPDAITAWAYEDRLRMIIATYQLSQE
ncbi:MAG: RNA polymerase sigma factor [Candidatus Hydrogenedentes bacterium]|nr:RNA polymerase sigma factor [Candidatus Hydrogenedentota bacterium]